MLEAKDYNNVRVYYFGCYTPTPGSHGVGHYMQASKYQPDISQTDVVRTSRFTEGNPWGHTIDGGLCPELRDTRRQKIYIYEWVSISTS